MQPPGKPANEAQRLAALRALTILDTSPEERFDRLTRLAQNILGVPIAVVSLVDESRQWFKSIQGLGAKETPREVSFCGHVILGRGLFVVPDATKDPRFADNPLVAGSPDIRFYAGFPLATAEGLNLGTLCVIDRKPREFGEREAKVLEDLAHLVERELFTADRDAALRSQREIQAAVDNSAVVSKTDAKGVITYVNDRFCELSGYSREELLGKRTGVLRSEVHPAEFFDELQKTVSAGRVWRGEVCNRAKDGALFWLASTITPVLGEGGKPVQFISIDHDVTGRRRAEEGLRQASDKLQAVLDSASHVSIISTDRDGLVTVFNKGAENLLGYRAAEMVGRLTPAVLHLPAEVESRGREMTREFGRPIAGFDVFVEYARRGGFDAREWTYVRKDGSHVPVNLTVTALRAGDGAILGFLGIAVDVSERRRAEAELARARDAALNLARAKSEFLANMSHEIRTPMNAVIGMTGLLLDTELAPQQAEYARTIRGAGDALLGVINDILDFSKAEAGGMTLEVTDFDPRALAEDAVALFTGKAKEKGLALAARVDPKVPSRLRGDVGRLRQILSNLVGNAVKFTDHGSVTVEARLLDEAEARARVRFEVRDTGIGISPEGRERLFKAFTQADASTTRKYGGTGLGLAISKKLVEAMGGDIGVDAEPGRGSTFWLEVSLPVGAAADPASEAKARRSVPPPVGAWGRSKILVAEDNPINQRVVLLQLGQLGCRADVVADGREAVAATAAIPYDIVFMDCQMPEMDGFEATAQIRRREERLGRRTVIVAMTANAMEGDRERCLAAGMDDYVPKPVRPEALAEAVRRWYKPVDAAAVAGLLALGDGAMFRELTEQFLGDAERRAAELGKSAAAGDFEAVRLTAHTLKGSSGTMGARGVQDLCGQLEAAAAAKDLSGAPKLLAVLAGELAAVADALRSAAAKA